MSKGLEYIINHVFLPPKLPQEDDSNATNSAFLTEQLLVALRSFQDHSPKQKRSEWIPCIKMIGNMQKLQDHSGGPLAERTGTTLREMIDGGTKIPLVGEITDI
jgi:hypothetical protein